MLLTSRIWQTMKKKGNSGGQRPAARNYPPLAGRLCYLNPVLWLTSMTVVRLIVSDRICPQLAVPSSRCPPCHSQFTNDRCFQAVMLGAPSRLAAQKVAHAQTFAVIHRQEYQSSTAKNGITMHGDSMGQSDPGDQAKEPIEKASEAGPGWAAHSVAALCHSGECAHCSSLGRSTRITTALPPHYHRITTALPRSSFACSSLFTCASCGGFCFICYGMATGILLRPVCATEFTSSSCEGQFCRRPA